MAELGFSRFGIHPARRHIEKFVGILYILLENVTLFSSLERTGIETH
jgi:hypothetical protein